MAKRTTVPKIDPWAGRHRDNGTTAIYKFTQPGPGNPIHPVFLEYYREDGIGGRLLRQSCPERGPKSPFSVPGRLHSC